MPRKPLDPRILILARLSTVEAQAVPATVADPDPFADKSHVPPEVASWAWCDVVLTATYSGQTAELRLTGRSYPGRAAFEASDDFRLAYAKVLTALMVKIDRAAEAAATLGPRARGPVL